MAVKTTGTEPASTKPADRPAASETKPANADVDEASGGRQRVESDCVVDEDFHVGRAVNGAVCSYHAMHYDAAGNRRT
jgi:hypothetical protein